MLNFEAEYNIWYNYKQLWHNYSLKSSVQCCNQCEHWCSHNDDCHFVLVKPHNANVIWITIAFITTTRTQQQTIPVGQIQLNYWYCSNHQATSYSANDHLWIDGNSFIMILIMFINCNLNLLYWYNFIRSFYLLIPLQSTYVVMIAILVAENTTIPLI